MRRAAQLLPDYHQPAGAEPMAAPLEAELTTMRRTFESLLRPRQVRSHESCRLCSQHYYTARRWWEEEKAAEVAAVRARLECEHQAACVRAVSSARLDAQAETLAAAAAAARRAASAERKVAVVAAALREATVQRTELQAKLNESASRSPSKPPESRATASQTATETGEESEKPIEKPTGREERSLGADPQLEMPRERASAPVRELAWGERPAVRFDFQARGAAAAQERPPRALYLLVYPADRSTQALEDLAASGPSPETHGQLLRLHAEARAQFPWRDARGDAELPRRGGTQIRALLCSDDGFCCGAVLRLTVVEEAFCDSLVLSLLYIWTHKRRCSDGGHLIWTLRLGRGPHSFARCWSASSTYGRRALFRKVPKRPRVHTDARPRPPPRRHEEVAAVRPGQVCATCPTRACRRLCLINGLARCSADSVGFRGLPFRSRRLIAAQVEV